MANNEVPLWQTDAKCIGEDTEIFFGDTTYAKGFYKNFCDDCPVKQFCLDFALIYNLSGVWGGTTYKERSKMSTIKIQMLRDDAIESGTYHYNLRA